MGIRQQSGDDNLFAYVQDNPINRLDPSGHDADSTEHEQRQNEQRQLTLPALSEQVAHSQGSSRRAMQLPGQLGGDSGPGASNLVDRRQGGPGFMNPVEHAGSVSNPKESGLMGLFNGAASAAGPGSASSSPSVHIDGDPASGFSFAARPARPHMPHVHHGQHAHQVQRTPQGVVTPGVVAGDPMMGFQANARPSTPAESGDIGLPTTQRTTPLPEMLGQPGPGSTPLIDRHQGGAGFINPIDASGATAVSKDRPASGLAGMFSSAASSGGPAPSQLTNEMILDPAGAFSYPRHAAAPTPHDTAPPALQHGVDPARRQAIQGVEGGGVPGWDNLSPAGGGGTSTLQESLDTNRKGPGTSQLIDTGQGRRSGGFVAVSDSGTSGAPKGSQQQPPSPSLMQRAANLTQRAMAGTALVPQAAQDVGTGNWAGVLGDAKGLFDLLRGKPQTEPNQLPPPPQAPPQMGPGQRQDVKGNQRVFGGGGALAGSVLGAAAGAAGGANVAPPQGAQPPQPGKQGPAAPTPSRDPNWKVSVDFKDNKGQNVKDPRQIASTLTELQNRIDYHYNRIHGKYGQSSDNKDEDEKALKYYQDQAKQWKNQYMAAAGAGTYNAHMEDFHLSPTVSAISHVSAAVGVAALTFASGGLAANALAWAGFTGMDLSLGVGFITGAAGSGGGNALNQWIDKGSVDYKEVFDKGFQGGVEGAEAAGIFHIVGDVWNMLKSIPPGGPAPAFATAGRGSSSGAAAVAGGPGVLPGAAGGSAAAGHSTYQTRDENPPGGGAEQPSKPAEVRPPEEKAPNENVRAKTPSSDTATPESPASDEGTGKRSSGPSNKPTEPETTEQQTGRQPVTKSPTDWAPPSTPPKGIGDPNDPNTWHFNATKDLDWRNRPGDVYENYHDALDEAFRRTGVPRDEFEITKTATSIDGKKLPVEYKVTKGPNKGAEVNVDDPGIVKSLAGPVDPHVGYQAPGKRYSGAGVRGHIILDKVPLARPRTGN